jgi:acetylornithine deacetylase/succinyl-diaminopimelate desuccinylase-like protein
VPSDALLKISFRLVANQDPRKILTAVEQFVADHTPAGIEHRITWGGPGVEACLVDIESAAFGALARAIGRAFDTDLVLPTREGGSGPEALLQQLIGAPMVFLGVGLPDDQIHAPNEKVSLPMLFRGAEAAAHLWDEFATLGTAGLKD